MASSNNDKAIFLSGSLCFCWRGPYMTFVAASPSTAYMVDPSKYPVCRVIRSRMKWTISLDNRWEIVRLSPPGTISSGCPHLSPRWLGHLHDEWYHSATYGTRVIIFFWGNWKKREFNMWSPPFPSPHGTMGYWDHVTLPPAAKKRVKKNRNISCGLLVWTKC